MPAISVIIPCYNEAKIIDRSVNVLRSAMHRCDRDFEIVLCNDGSIDGTSVHIQKLADRHQDVKAVDYQPNRGAGYAFRQGLEVAKGNYVMHMDADLAMDPAELVPIFVEALRSHDIVIASRYKGIKADYPLRRRLPSLIYSQVYRRLLMLPIRDAMSGFFAIRAEVLTTIAPLEMDGFEIYLELFVKANQKGYSIQEIPAKFTHQTDSGEVSVSTYALAQLANTFRVWKRFGNSRTGDCS